MKTRLAVFDTTLRDGAQSEGISFSVNDKLNILRSLDNLGVKYIEAGNPGSNPKDIAFFEKAGAMHLKTACLVAFGSTRRKNTAAQEDTNLQALLNARTKAVAIFGKSWDLHVTDIIGATLAENLLMIEETIAFLKQAGREVIFDAEHFFDGYRANPAYAMETLQAAHRGGADSLVLCDTNGGFFPDNIFRIVQEVTDAFPDTEIGIHCHNDGGMAVANSVMAVLAGARQVQGTLNGIGERCGNANLASIIPNLQIKRNFECIPEENLQDLTDTARAIAEIANMPLQSNEPYVGKSAFAHKAGMHVDGVLKDSVSFEHVNPDIVGNERRFLVSEMAGRTALLNKISHIVPTLTKDSAELKQIVDDLKRMEQEGYQFEGAESSFELFIRKHTGLYRPFFRLINFKVINEQPEIEGTFATAMIKIQVGDKTEIRASEGTGPVHALDKALRQALEVFYPSVTEMRLIDYKVRVMESRTGTAAKVRVLIESSDADGSWTTVGVSTDIIEASWMALVDSIEYKLIRDTEAKKTKNNHNRAKTALL
jgi:2-isopropylmalate synthase